MLHKDKTIFKFIFIMVNKLDKNCKDAFIDVKCEVFKECYADWIFTNPRRLPSHKFNFLLVYTVYKTYCI